MRFILLGWFLTLHFSFLAGFSSHADTKEAVRIAEMEKKISNIKTAQDGLELLGVVHSVSVGSVVVSSLKKDIFDASFPLVEDITVGIKLVSEAIRSSYFPEYITERLREIATLHVHTIKEGIVFLRGAQRYLSEEEVLSVKNQTQALFDAADPITFKKNFSEYLEAVKAYQSPEERQSRLQQTISKIQNSDEGADEGAAVLVDKYSGLSPKERRMVLDATLSRIEDEAELNEKLIMTGAIHGDEISSADPDEKIMTGIIYGDEISSARKQLSDRLAKSSPHLQADSQYPAEQEERGFFSRCLNRFFHSEK